jgi:FKBP-type peptidyl-prolyl cis-trans isomerase
MIRKILAINGGGILDVAYLSYMLKLSKYYDKKNIDVLSLFNTYSGVSSGSIIATSFALREKFLQNIAKRKPNRIISALKKVNPEYSKNECLDIIENLKKMKVTNCSSIIIATLLIFFQTEVSNIFNRSTFRKIVSVNGILFSKYDDNKKHIFDEYFNFTLKDVPDGRTLVIKSIDVTKIKLQVYTNYVTSEKNDFLINNPNESISKAIHFSTNAESLFPFNKMIDGSTILNTSLLEQVFFFKNDELVIFKLSNIIKPFIKNIVFDGILGWAYPLLKIGIIDGYENEIFKELLKFKYQEKIHISEFDFTNYQIDAINKFSEIENIGQKKSVKSATEFIDNILMNNEEELAEGVERTTTSGLRISDIKIGAGPKVRLDQTVWVNYRGSFENGKEFDSSYTVDREPFAFTLGTAQVIKGWDEGITGMQVGGKRKLVVHPALAYGDLGVEGEIPPNATLIFEVELLKIT